jgi:hypothetical protein
LRWYNITPTNTSGVLAVLRLYYRSANPDERNGNTNPSNLRIFHCNGTTWTQLSGTHTPDSDADGEYVELPDVSEFSPYAIAPSSSAPTNIVLSAFRLKATTKPSVKVKWETGTELAVVGFNVYRAAKLNGTYKLLNVEMIDPKSPGQIVGNNYTYTDKRVKHGKTYYYKLEVIQAGTPNETSQIKKVQVP